MTIYENKVREFGPRYMKDLDLTKEQVAGIFGNFYAETGGFTLMQEVKPLVPGSRGGYGWAQWTGPRRRQYEDWCKRNERNPADDLSNYEFSVYELTHSEKKALERLRQTKTPKEAAESFCKNYERPGIPHMNTRYKGAEIAYEVLSTKQIEDVLEAPRMKYGLIAYILSGVILAIAAGWDWIVSLWGKIF